MFIGGVSLPSSMSSSASASNSELGVFISSPPPSIRFPARIYYHVPFNQSSLPHHDPLPPLSTVSTITFPSPPQSLPSSTLPSLSNHVPLPTPPTKQRHPLTLVMAVTPLLLFLSDTSLRFRSCQNHSLLGEQGSLARCFFTYPDNMAPLHVHLMEIRSHFS